MAKVSVKRILTALDDKALLTLRRATDAEIRRRTREVSSALASAVSLPPPARPRPPGPSKPPRVPRSMEPTDHGSELAETVHIAELRPVSPGRLEEGERIVSLASALCALENDPLSPPSPTAGPTRIADTVVQRQPPNWRSESSDQWGLWFHLSDEVD